MDLTEAGAAKRQHAWAGWWLVAALLVALATAAILLAMGRPPICTCGTVKLWAGAVQSADNSQHLSDWYTPSHIIHGLLFYWAAAKLLPRQPLGIRLLPALLVEAAWEIAENSPAVIDRYRQATMAAGFWLASRLPWRWSVALALLFEVGTLAAVRDNLTLNVLMLVAPVDAIKRWQAG